MKYLAKNSGIPFNSPNLHMLSPKILSTCSNDISGSQLLAQFLQMLQILLSQFFPVEVGSRIFVAAFPFGF
jgi:hypothetical protein